MRRGQAKYSRCNDGSREDVEISLIPDQGNYTDRYVDEWTWGEAYHHFMLQSNWITFASFFLLFLIIVIFMSSSYIPNSPLRNYQYY